MSNDDSPLHDRVSSPDSAIGKKDPDLKKVDRIPVHQGINSNAHLNEGLHRCGTFDEEHSFDDSALMAEIRQMKSELESLHYINNLLLRNRLGKDSIHIMSKFNSKLD